MDKPIFRFNNGKTIYVFQTEDDINNIDELQQFLNEKEQLTWIDNTKINPKNLTNLMAFTIDCPVGFILTSSGEFVKNY